MTSSASVSPRARQALKEAAKWIADDDPVAARRLRDAVADAARLIAARPMAGRAQPSLVGAEYRIWSLSGFPYLLVYLPTPRPPQIVRIIHTARDLPAALADLRD